MFYKIEEKNSCRKKFKSGRKKLWVKHLCMLSDIYIISIYRQHVLQNILKRRIHEGRSSKVGEKKKQWVKAGNQSLEFTPTSVST